MNLGLVWTIADIFNALMAIPNLMGLLALSGVVAAETRDFNKIRAKKSLKRNKLVIQQMPSKTSKTC